MEEVILVDGEVEVDVSGFIIDVGDVWTPDEVFLDANGLDAALLASNINIDNGFGDKGDVAESAVCTIPRDTFNELVRCETDKTLTGMDGADSCCDLDVDGAEIVMTTASCSDGGEGDDAVDVH